MKYKIRIFEITKKNNKKKKFERKIKLFKVRVINFTFLSAKIFRVEIVHFYYFFFFLFSYLMRVSNDIEILTSYQINRIYLNFHSSIPIMPMFSHRKLKCVQDDTSAQIFVTYFEMLSNGAKFNSIEIENENVNRKLGVN